MKATRSTHRMRCRSLWLAAAFAALLWGSAAHAQTTASAPDGPPLVAGLAGAADSVGAPGWDDPDDNRTVIHVALVLERKQALLLVGVPGSVPRKVAEPWLDQLVSRLGWSDARVTWRARSGNKLAAILSREVVRTPTLTESSLEVNLTAIRAAVRELHSGPMLLCVRAPGAITSVTPAPEHRVLYRQRNFLFYAHPTAAALHVEYGLPARWLAAAISGLLLWLLVPLVLGLAGASFLRKRGAAPAAYLAPYRSWNLAIRAITLGGIALTMTALGRGGDAIGYFGPGFVVLRAVAWLLYLPLWSVIGLLLQIASPWLSRGPAPERRPRISYLISMR